MSRYEPRIHIQSERFKTLTLCGRPWADSRGGEPRSDTHPPVVKDVETGSVNQASCQACLVRWRRMRANPA
jgi:hypothetical protein